MTFFFLNSTLKSQSTSSKPTGLKETSPMYSYTIHKYSIYIYFNPQQTAWTTRFSSKRLTPPSRSSSSNNTATLQESIGLLKKTLQEREVHMRIPKNSLEFVRGASSSATFPGETVVACLRHTPDFTFKPRT